MSKIKTYRTLGYILTVFGIVGFILSICQPHKFQSFMANPTAELLPALYGILMVLALNIFLWAGLLSLRKADRLDNPDKESKWNKIIRPYKKFLIVMLIITVILIIVPNILRYFLKKT